MEDDTPPSDGSVGGDPLHDACSLLNRWHSLIAE